ncbi:MAG: hypothetical protein J1F13_00545 [Prevotellaceae bacterium]|nr:hypothetical protein [Prevotellaceae bacterium]
MGLLRTGIVKRSVFKDGKKLFPTVLLYSNITDRELINYMLQNSQVGRTTAVAAVEAFKAAFTTFLLNGHTMVVPAVGTFSLSAKCKAVDSLKDVGRSIQRLRIRYTPESIIKVAAKSSQFRGLLEG